MNNLVIALIVIGGTVGYLLASTAISVSLVTFDGEKGMGLALSAKVFELGFLIFLMAGNMSIFLAVVAGIIFSVVSFLITYLGFNGYEDFLVSMKVVELTSVGLFMAMLF